MKILPRLLIFTATLGAFFGIFSSKALAAKMYLSPETGNYLQPFSVDVMLNPEADKIDAVDVILTYDTAKLDVSEIANGDFEQYLKKSFNKATGRIEISALNATSPATVQTKIAKITFSPLSNGSTKVDFVYTPGAVDDTNALEKGIESLTDVSGATYTLGSAVPAGNVVVTDTAPGNNMVPASTAPVPNTGTLPDSMYLYSLMAIVFTSIGFLMLKRV